MSVCGAELLSFMKIKKDKMRVEILFIYYIFVKKL